MPFKGLTNNTPFASDMSLLADENGRDILLVLVKATYQIIETDKLAVAMEQSPICFEGEYYGEPGLSSLRYAPEANFAKQSTDVSLIGHAHAPRGTEVTQLDVRLQVGELGKTVRVIGDRFWQNRNNLLWSNWTISTPKPFSKMPLKYELAFGGSDNSSENPEDHFCVAQNLVGSGAIANNSQRSGQKLPNLEDPKQLIRSPRDKPSPAGFGPLSPDWQPRLALAGTYDSHWEKTRLPLLPTNFDRRFFNTASSGLVANRFLQGNETVSVTNASVRGRLNFSLPGHRPSVMLTLQNQTPLSLACDLDSLIIDTDQHLVHVLWRSSADIYLRIHELEHIETRLENVSSIAA